MLTEWKIRREPTVLRARGAGVDCEVQCWIIRFGGVAAVAMGSGKWRWGMGTSSSRFLMGEVAGAGKGPVCFTSCCCWGDGGAHRPPCGRQSLWTLNSRSGEHFGGADVGMDDDARSIFRSYRTSRRGYRKKMSISGRAKMRNRDESRGCTTSHL